MLIGIHGLLIMLRIQILEDKARFGSGILLLVFLMKDQFIENLAVNCHFLSKPIKKRLLGKSQQPMLPILLSQITLRASRAWYAG